MRTEPLVVKRERALLRIVEDMVGCPQAKWRLTHWSRAFGAALSFAAYYQGELEQLQAARRPGRRPILVPMGVDSDGESVFLPLTKFKRVFAKSEAYKAWHGTGKRGRKASRTDQQRRELVALVQRQKGRSERARLRALIEPGLAGDAARLRLDALRQQYRRDKKRLGRK